MHFYTMDTKNKKRKVEDYMVGEYLNTEEFLTEKEKRSFEQVEKYVNNNREPILQNMAEKKAERWEMYDFIKDWSFDCDWEEKFINSQLEMMIEAVNKNSQKNGNWWNVKSVLMYIIYLVVILLAIILLIRQNGIM